MSRKRWLALITAAMLLVGSVAFNLMTADDGDVLLDTKAWKETVIETGENIEGSIVLLELNGTIQNIQESFFSSGYNHKNFLSQLDHAAEDPYVEGVVIAVNTPGGGVLESAEIHERIVRMQEEFEKPVFISMGGMAASGGYYIAAPADKIVASPHTLTGSIGVIMESINLTGLAEKYGVKFNTIKSGPHKDILSPTREMTEEERDILQSLIDESYEEFVQIIVDGRGLSNEKVRQIADGRIYSGRQAMELDLVDELGSLDDTITYMKDLLQADYPVVKYESGGGFGQFFSMSMEKISGQESELAILERVLQHDRSPTLKYLYAE